MEDAVEIDTQTSTNDRVSRRRLLLAGATAITTSALSYGKIIGANDRISLGHIGVGNRGRELASVAASLKESHKIEMTAVCDLWTVNRERAAKKAAGIYGREPRAFGNMEELLALKDVDAVIVSTAD